MGYAIDKLINRFGTPMVLVRGETENTIRAFLQETGSRSQRGSQWDFMALGQVPTGMYVYIGPVEPEAAVGDLLKYRGKILELRRTEMVMVGEKPTYCWGVCVEKGGEESWGS